MNKLRNRMAEPQKPSSSEDEKEEARSDREKSGDGEGSMPLVE